MGKIIKVKAPKRMRAPTPSEKLYALIARAGRCNPCPWIKGIRPNVPSTKVIICGSRDFEDYSLLEKLMDRYTYWLEPIEVVLGGEGKRIERGGEWVWVGADQMGKRWAEKRWWDRKFFYPNWKGKHKRGAGMARNNEMAKYVAPDGFCVAFWDEESPGTKNMIEQFLKYNPKEHLKIVRY